MNRFIFGRGWSYQEEADDGTQGGAGGGAAGGDGGNTYVDAGGDTAVDDAGAKKDGAAPAGEQGGAKKEEAPADMKSAIDAALGYKKGPNGEELDPLTGKVKEAEPVKKPAAGAEEKHANGTPKKNEKGEALDDKGQVVKAAAPKLKTSAELALSADERKQLGPRANMRFGELMNTLKTHEAARAKDAEQIKALAEGRDAILSVMEETGTSQEQLAGYLELNALLHSKDPKDLESALGWIEQQRASLYTALGKEPEGGGIDLLKDFPDLKKQVDEEEITREAALEIAHGRREKAARQNSEQRQQLQQRHQSQTAAQQKQASETALKDIEAWTAELKTSDLDYKAKEDKLLGETLDGVLKDYPPHLWLPTLKRLYAGIEITKAAPAGNGQKPLRPSGARPGNKAPADMLDAINQGLGYAGAEKG